MVAIVRCLHCAVASHVSLYSCNTLLTRGVLLIHRIHEQLNMECDLLATGRETSVSLFSRFRYPMTHSPKIIRINV